MRFNSRRFPTALKISLGILVFFVILLFLFLIRIKVAESRAREFAKNSYVGMSIDQLETLAKAHHLRPYYVENHQTEAGRFHAIDGFLFYGWGCSVQCEKKVSTSRAWPRPWIKDFAHAP